MTKPLAAALVRSASRYDGPEPQRVEIRRSKARHAVAGFYAPQWRPMVFRSVEGARAKLERHPGFVRWEV